MNGVNCARPITTTNSRIQLLTKRHSTPEQPRFRCYPQSDHSGQAHPALENPIADRPEMCAAIIIVQQEVKSKMQERCPAQGNRHGRAGHRSQSRCDAPQDDQVIDPKDALPAIREIKLAKGNFARCPSNDQMPACQEVPQQIWDRRPRRHGGPTLPNAVMMKIRCLCYSPARTAHIRI